MQLAFTGYTTTRQSPASSRTRSNIGALAAVMAVAALTVLVPTRILAQATGGFLPLPAQAKPPNGRHGHTVKGVASRSDTRVSAPVRAASADSRMQSL